MPSPVAHGGCRRGVRAGLAPPRGWVPVRRRGGGAPREQVSIRLRTRGDKSQVADVRGGRRWSRSGRGNGPKCSVMTPPSFLGLSGSRLRRTPAFSRCRALRPRTKRAHRSHLPNPLARRRDERGSWWRGARVMPIVWNSLGVGRSLPPPAPGCCLRVLSLVLRRGNSRRQRRRPESCGAVRFGDPTSATTDFSRSFFSFVWYCARDGEGTCLDGTTRNRMRRGGQSGRLCR